MGQTSGFDTSTQNRSFCRLCGLPAGASNIRQPMGAETLLFCCHGCHQVYLLLSAATGTLPQDFQDTELYRVCVESGIVPGFPKTIDRESPSDQRDLPPLELACTVEGMWCPSCAWLLEEVIRRTSGVIDSRVSFVSDTAHVRYLPHVTSPDEIASRVAKLGYRLAVRSVNGGEAKEKKSLLLRLVIAAVLTENIMMISFVVYSGFFWAFSQTVIGYFSYPLLIMTTLVLFYGGFPILRRGFESIRYRTPSMDTLVSLGALSAYLYSLVQVFRGSLYLYFDTAAMLVTFVLLGRYLETRLRERASAGIGDLYAMAHSKVRMNDGGKERWVAADVARLGDAFTVVAGDVVPLDATVVSGGAMIDESFLTGESRPRPLGPGDTAAGGTSVREGELLLEVKRTVSESLVGQIVAATEEALAKKNSYELLADRISRAFVPVVLLLAASTALITWLSHVPVNEVLLRSLTVLLISCPCALGIAIPLVKIATVHVARRRGILVREPEAFERMKDLDTMVFDKTGTLTEGNFCLRCVVSGRADRAEVLDILASVEVHSRHFLAKEIVREAGECPRCDVLRPAEEFEEFEGLGVKGRVQGMAVHIGNRRFMELNGYDVPPGIDQDAESWEKQGSTAVFFGWEGLVQGFLAFGDSVRQGSREFVHRLQQKQITVWIVSGDAESTTEAVAKSLGIGHFKGQVLPDGKVEFIKSLQDAGYRVGAIGDGLNDAAALAQADVGCAFGAGMNLIREASDLTFLSPQTGRLMDALTLSALSARTVRQNLIFAFVYNAIAIPVAALGFLNPLVAVVAMFLSSLTVTANALRMSHAKFA